MYSVTEELQHLLGNDITDLDLDAVAEDIVSDLLQAYHLRTHCKMGVVKTPDMDETLWKKPDLPAEKSIFSAQHELCMAEYIINKRFNSPLTPYPYGFSSSRTVGPPLLSWLPGLCPSTFYKLVLMLIRALCVGTPHLYRQKLHGITCLISLLPPRFQTVRLVWVLRQGTAVLVGQDHRAFAHTHLASLRIARFFLVEYGRDLVRSGPSCSVLSMYCRRAACRRSH